MIHLHGESPNLEPRYASTCIPPAIAVPHATSLRDFVDCKSAMHDSLTSRTPFLRTPKPRSPMPPVLHSAIRKSRFRKSRFLVHKVTDLAQPRIPTPQDPLPRVPPMIDGSRQFGKSPVAISKSMRPLPPETSNAKLRYPGFDATYPCPDRRPRLIREIAGRDFTRYKILTSPNSECRNPEVPDSCHLSPQTDGYDCTGVFLRVSRLFPGA